MKKQISTLSLICLCLTTLTTATYGQAFNQVFKTEAVLPAAMLQSTDFRLAPETTVKDYEFQFEIETRFGIFAVSGIPLLERRILELRRRLKEPSP